ncbi:MAG: TMEM165/GDT1 family protein [Candidatus Saccharimonadales bacterium]|jgi:putative Ca2+/H+ antiporter (TMEM165/GDT1 family)
MDLGIAALVFGVIFISELPDKSMFASLILGMRYRKKYVWLGAAAAFLIHVLIAVTAGQAFSLLPHRVVESVVAALFLLGALLLLFGGHGLEDEKEEERKLKKKVKAPNFWKIFGTSFSVIFIGEWGDITQIATANYAARYHDPISVGLGAVAALWAVAAIAVLAGSKLLKIIPATLLQRITAIILLIFAVISAYSAIRG